MKLLSIILLVLTSVAGMAQEKSYMIVFLNKKLDATKLNEDESKRIMEGHMANMQRLAKENKLLAAGPFDGGGGIFIMNSTSEDEVKTWISTDPGVKASRWNVEILPYKPRVGAICPQEKIEMVHYSFVRYDVLVSKFTAKDYPEIVKQHDEYLQHFIKTGNVVTEAIFGARDGGILVLKGEIDPKIIENDPAIQQGLIQHQIKKLYIAKGSFCEQ